MTLSPANWRGITPDDYRDILRACDQAAGLLARDDVLVVDTETTDLDGEIIQIAAVDTRGQPVINTLVHPQRPVTAGAFAVHHISNAMLRGAPSWREVAKIFEPLALGKLLISYNAPFDQAMVRNSYQAVRLNSIPLYWECAMRLYARYLHIPGKYGDFRWVPLPGGDHSALGDVLATLEVLQVMARDRGRLLGIVRKLQA
jgi:DNA polymerase-3 subunit epsilon